ncbi:nucleoside phosphorylase domain-containing protein [Aspergillus terricola var. indicus]
MAAARAMLDEVHDALPTSADDSNTYTLGRIAQHNVVIACLPADQYGTNNAANIMTNMKRTFPRIRAGLIVGIGGGVPNKADVRLGDIVVGTRVMQASTVEETDPGRCDNSLGAIALGNQVMKTGVIRDRIAQQLDVICFEMEAAGLMDILPCLPIRGICDYADSHKSDGWQRYAAAVAAAYARELLEELPVAAAPGSVYTSNNRQCSSHETQHERWRRLLESLRFDQIDSRKSTIKTAHAKTCRWFVSHPDYQALLDPEQLKNNHGFLWISGKPGADKSTIMKFAYMKMKNKAHHKNAVTASFFFNARGELLESSILGMYRSLLLQLLEGFPDLQAVLDNIDLIPLNQNGCPSLNALKALFCNAITALGQHQFTCFVDALDECDKQQVVDMVLYF